MSMDTSSVSSDKPSSSNNTTTNKKRPYGSMDGKRASGGEPRLSGGELFSCLYFFVLVYGVV